MANYFDTGFWTGSIGGTSMDDACHNINVRPAGYSGELTSTYFKDGEQWYGLRLSGHCHADDDNRWILKVIAK